MLKATEKDIARFMSKVDFLPNGCWYWMGGRSRGKGNKKFYGSFSLNGKTVRAHRFSSEVFNKDECPPGHHRDHLCDFSMCVGPHHIQVVTHEENQSRKMKRQERFAAQRLCPTPAQQKEQGENCGCKGTDEYCACQNVVVIKP